MPLNKHIKKPVSATHLNSRRTPYVLEQYRLLLEGHLEYVERPAFECMELCAQRYHTSRGDQQWVPRWTAFRNFILANNIKLIGFVMYRRGVFGQDRFYDEILSLCHTTLMKSVEGFSISYGTKFSTYACTSLHLAICRFKRHCRQVGLNLKTPRTPVCMDVIDPIHMAAPDEQYDDVNSIRDIMDRNLCGLSKLEELIISHRFYGDETMTLDQLGHLIGLSKERVRQIQQMALGKIKTAYLYHGMCEKEAV